MFLVNSLHTRAHMLHLLSLADWVTAPGIRLVNICDNLNKRISSTILIISVSRYDALNRQVDFSTLSQRQPARIYSGLQKCPKNVRLLFEKLTSTGIATARAIYWLIMKLDGIRITMSLNRSSITGTSTEKWKILECDFGTIMTVTCADAKWNDESCTMGTIILFIEDSRG